MCMELYKLFILILQIAKEQASAGEKGRAELEHANKELLLIGELQLKYQEALNKLSSVRQTDQELEYFKETHKHELKSKLFKLKKYYEISFKFEKLQR